MTERRDIHVRVSVEEHAAAVAFAIEHGVSLAAITTALCRWLASQEETSPEVERCIKMLLAEARRVDEERQRRSTPPAPE